jgi:hypothetical protein
MEYRPDRFSSGGASGTRRQAERDGKAHFSSERGERLKPLVARGTRLKMSGFLRSKIFVPEHKAQTSSGLDVIVDSDRFAFVSFVDYHAVSSSVRPGKLSGFDAVQTDMRGNLAPSTETSLGGVHIFCQKGWRKGVERHSPSPRLARRVPRRRAWDSPKNLRALCNF